MKKFEYKVMAIPTAVALGTKGYEKIAAEFEIELNKLFIPIYFIFKKN